MHETKRSLYRSLQIKKHAIKITQVSVVPQCACHTPLAQEIDDTPHTRGWLHVCAPVFTSLTRIHYSVKQMNTKSQLLNI